MKLRIFLVEDSALLLQRIRADIVALEMFDVVGHADTQDDAVRSIDELDPQVVVTDLQLKVGSGISVLRQVRASHPKPPPHVFVLTNYAMPEYKERCLTYGADGFFDKSTQYDLFLATLQQTARESPGRASSGDRLS
jgi:DNA-binding NarL/FixJ family response regulator